MQTQVKEPKYTTTRVDLKSRICLMAALIYSTSDQNEGDIDRAVNAACLIEQAAEKASKRLKEIHPVPDAQRIR